MVTEKELILKGNLKTLIWQMSWPAVLAMVLYGLNSFLDAVFVGQLMNETALAGVGVAYPLSQITLGFGSLIGTGAATAISIWIGANETEKLHKVLGTVNVLVISFSILYTICTFIFADKLVAFMGGKNEVAVYAESYFKSTIWASIFWIHGLSLNMIVRGEGKMKTAAWMIALGLAVDVALKPLFIKTFGWGVEGAAWATNVAMIVYSAIGIWYFTKGKSSFKTESLSFKIDFDIAIQILKLGFSGMIITIMTVLQSAVVLNALVKFGNGSDLTFYTVCNRILLFLMMPIIGLMRAIQPIIGMNFGAEQFDRLKHSYKLFITTGFLLILPFWLMLNLFPEKSIHAMAPTLNINEGYIANFRIYLLVLPLLPIVFMALATLPAINRPKETAMIAMLRQIILYFPFMFFVPKLFGVSSIYWGSTLMDLMIIILSLVIVNNSFKKLATAAINKI
jgi:putative MATE family efflux protein